MSMTATAPRSHSVTRGVKYLAVAALAFQAVHFVEHLAQLGYWLMHPAEAPWLTPWAAGGRDLLAFSGRSALGNELLHLVGNLIFLAGLGALLTYCHWRGRAAAYPPLRIALLLQGVHVLEHLALTATTVVFGKAIGLSTFFGLVGGPLMTSYRVWFHLLINLVASWYGWRALVAMHADGLLLDSSPRPTEARRAVGSDLPGR